MADDVIGSVSVPAADIGTAATAMDAFAQSTQNLSLAMDLQRQSAGSLGQAVGSLGQTMGSSAAQSANLYAAGINNANKAAQEYINLSGAQKNATAALAGAMLGANSGMTEFSNGMKALPIESFISSWGSLSETLNNSAGADIMSGALSGLADNLGRLGQPVEGVINAIKGGSEAMLGFVKNIVSSASEAQNFHNAQLQLATSSGDFANIIRSANPDLSNLNEILNQNSQSLSQSSIETGKAIPLISEFYKELSAIPGTLNAQVDGLEDSSAKTTLLTSAMNLAAGSGQDVHAIINDVAMAYNEYGVQGQKALEMSAKFSEVSMNLEIPLNVVRSSLEATAAGFKGVADAGDASARQFSSLANISNQYYGSLRNAGFTSQGAMDVIKQTTSAVSGLTTAQKAFISQQSGGSGGLMGAFQLEKQLEDGDVEGVFNKVRDTLLKQLGGNNIVSLEDAGQSEGAANQYQKQLSMLQNGPLGKFATNDRDAGRLLEGLSNNDASSFKPLSDKTLQQQSMTGQTLMGQSRTSASDLAAELSRTQFNVNLVNADTIQNIFAKNRTSGIAGQETDAQRTASMNLANSTRGQTNGLDGDLASFKTLIANMPDAIKSVASGFIQAVNSGDKVGADQQRKVLEDNIKTAQARNQVSDETRRQQLFVSSLSSFESNSQRLNGTARVQPATVQQNASQTNTANLPDAATSSTHEIVIKGMCIECGKNIKEGSIARSTAPQAFTGNR